MMTNALRHARACLLLLLAAAAPAGAHAQAGAPASSAAAHDGARAFDFEFGEWTVQISRLVEPLSGSTAWAEYTGTSVVRPVWGGHANLGELEVNGATGRIQGMSLRLYDPAARQWKISWASSRDGALGPPMIGGFRDDGTGEFYNQETFNGRAVFVRFVFSGITANAFRLEQAFSADGGKSWEVNWIARFQR
ncbi:MAG TPA: hypothetical protein VE871_14380 [Longimicrobium sp.]|nr:hypothetical protein [Longimicrobium sp.]